MLPQNVYTLLRKCYCSKDIAILPILPDANLSGPASFETTDAVGCRDVETFVGVSAVHEVQNGYATTGGVAQVYGTLEAHGVTFQNLGRYFFAGRWSVCG